MLGSSADPVAAAPYSTGSADSYQPQYVLYPDDDSAFNDAIAGFKHYLASLRKRWPLVLAIVAGAVLIAFIATLRAVPIYQATALLKIEEGNANILNIQQAGSAPWVDEERAISTQVELIQSRALAERVVKTLNLAADSEFFEKMKLDSETGGGSLQQVRAAREKKAIDALQGNLNVSPKKGTRIIEVAFEAPDAALSSTIANGYAAAAMRADLDRGLDTTQFAREFLGTRLDQTKARLEASEREMIAYARQADLIDTSSGGSKDEGASSPSLGIANLVAINQAYAAARTKRLELEAQWRKASSTAAMAQPQLLESPSIQGLMSSRAETSAQYESLGVSKTPDHPEMKRLMGRMRDLDRSIAREASNFRASLKTRFDLAQAQEQSLNQEIGRLKSFSLDEQDRNVQLGILKREVDTNRAFYDALLQRYKEISAASGAYANTISVVDKAQRPDGPVRPRPLLNLLLGLGLGIALALVTVYLLEMFDDSVKTPEQLQQDLGLASIGVVPMNGQALDLHEDILDNRSDIAEAYMAIKAALSYTTPTGCPSPLLITSTRSSEGKTTTALATALAFTRVGKRVLLIDADLRKPSLHTLLALDNETGLSELLSSQKSLSQVIKPALDNRLHVITSGPLPPDPAGLLAAARFEAVLAEAQLLYDIIFVDGPPVLGMADAPLIGAACEGTLFVIQAGETRTNQNRAALSRLKATRTKIIGAVLTKFDRRSVGYGEDYGYAYKEPYQSEA